MTLGTIQRPIGGTPAGAAAAPAPQAWDDDGWALDAPDPEFERQIRVWEAGGAPWDPEDARDSRPAAPASRVAAAARAAVAGLARAEAGEALFAGFRAACVEWAEAGNGVRDNLGAAELLTRAQRWAESQAARALARAELDAPLEGQDRRNMAEEHGLRTAQTLFEARRLARAGRAGLGFPEIREAQDAGVFPAASCDAVMSAANRVSAPEAKAQVVGFGIRLALSAPPSKLRAGVGLLAARLDPAAAGKGRREAVDGRNVRVSPKPDGMAELRAYGPAELVRLVQAGIEDAARRLAAFDRETMDSRKMTAG
ncbi:MAG: hypothetical protein LBL01_03375, partial [Bifidobacteriaceae bacterium]|nr:hypothetical protein [Bifidobacteriaceae bacterium]